MHRAQVCGRAWQHAAARTPTHPAAPRRVRPLCVCTLRARLPCLASLHAHTARTPFNMHAPPPNTRVHAAPLTTWLYSRPLAAWLQAAPPTAWLCASPSSWTARVRRSWCARWEYWMGPCRSARTVLCKNSCGHDTPAHTHAFGQLRPQSSCRVEEDWTQGDRHAAAGCAWAGRCMPRCSGGEGGGKGGENHVWFVRTAHRQCSRSSSN